MADNGRRGGGARKRSVAYQYFSPKPAPEPAPEVGGSQGESGKSPPLTLRSARTILIQYMCIRHPAACSWAAGIFFRGG